MAFKALGDLFGAKKPKLETTADYQQWRKVIFAVEPEQVDISKSEVDRVYGVVMDIGMLDQQHATHWAMSLSAFPTGEASFRPTVGGGVVGLGGNPQVAQAAQEIVQIAQTLWPATEPTQDLSLPEPGFVQFFLLTTSGVRRVKDHLDKMQRPDNPFGLLLDRFAFIRRFADALRS